MRSSNNHGAIFNIQAYSIHDGPGIRTTAFLKGCPLRCVWCQNPESQTFDPVLFFNTEKCTGCGTCLNVCEQDAIVRKDDKIVTLRDRCTGCGKCVDVCPNEARSILGEDKTPEEVFERIHSDKIFYDNSGGGATLSGGDAVAQPTFAISILKLCRNANIHTAIETSGYTKWETFKRILEHVDLVLYDLKHMDPSLHKQYTGVSNEMILDNAKKIYHELHIPMLARIPVIPGYNDSSGNMEKTADFILQELGPDVKVHLLPYHRLGESKYERMEDHERLQSLNIEPPNDDRMSLLMEIFQSKGLSVTLGG